MRREIAKFIENGVLDNSILASLADGDELAGIECDLWDYKREYGTTEADVSELIRDIAAFHNSYGGYLIFGVSDPEHGQPATAIGVPPGQFNLRQLRDKIAASVSVRIDVAYAEVQFGPPGRVCVIGLLYVPQRRSGEPPVTFTRNGANKASGKPVFRVGTIPMREGDTSRIAESKDDLAFLLADRVHVFSSEDALRVAQSAAETVPLPNNLPDRSLICPRFVGREAIVSSLWRWLADPFVFVRVLAGDGGKGKTSIAYQFASEVAQRRVAGLEQVIWLSAKQKQFYGLENAYRALPRHDYTDMTTLLRAICECSGLVQEELADAPVETLRVLASQALATVPALIVVDDVDSCEVDEQRRIHELALHIGSRKSRFLLTTRANVSYSSDLAIKVPGLPRPEYDALVESLLERLQIVQGKRPDIGRLHTATDGSPLLTESILRLVRLGMSYADAINQWRGQAGRDARSAALKKEVDRLSPEARRVLLAIALLGECSRSELKQLTAYQDLRMSDALEELQSLFLIDAPRLTEDEPRFTMSEITRTLVLDERASLIPDATKLAQSAKELRRREIGSAGSWVVGAAINQANAQLKAGDVETAVDTLTAALKRYPEHRDLLSMLGHAYLVMEPPRLNDARDRFHKAYARGCRRPELFRDWYEAEILAGNPASAIAVCGYALEKLPNDVTWQRQRAYARAMLGEARLKVGDYGGALQLLEEAAGDLADAIALSKGPRRHEYVSEAAALHDKILRIARTWTSGNEFAVFDAAWNAIMRGDIRGSNYTQLLDNLEEVIRSRRQILPDSRVDKSLAVYLQKAEDALAKRPDSEGDGFVEKFLRRLREIEADYQRRRSRG